MNRIDFSTSGSKKQALNALLASVSLSEMAKVKITSAATMPPLKDLDKKWGAFKNHMGLYEAAYGAYAYVGRMITAREFQPNQSEFYSDQPNKELQSALNEKGKSFNYMDIQPKFIETRMNFSDLQVKLNFAGNTQSMMDAETILKSLFPTFKMPSKWERKTVQMDRGGGKTENQTQISIGDDLIVDIPLEKFATIKPRFTSTNEKLPPDTLKFAPSKEYYKNHFDKIVKLRLTLKQNDVRLNFPVNGTEGELSSGVNYPIIDMTVEAVFDWPIQFAYYVTCSTGTADFIPFLFYQYIVWHRLVYGSNRTRGGGMGQRPARINHLGNIIASNEKEKMEGRNPQPRVNKEGFIVLGVGEHGETGSIVRIPSAANNVNDYLSQIKGSYDGTTKQFDLTKVKLKASSLLTDWYNDKFTYLRESGVGLASSDISGIQTLDLTGSVPLDNVTIYRKLAKDFVDEGPERVQFDWFLSVCQKFLQGDYKNAKRSKAYFSLEYLNSVGATFDSKSHYIYDAQALTSWIKSRIQSFPGKITWANIGGAPLKADTIDGDKGNEASNPAKFKNIRAALNILKDAAADMLPQLDAIDLGYYTKIEQFSYVLYLITQYAAKFDEYQKETEAKIAANSIKEISDAVFDSYVKNDLTMPNLTGVKAFMPHQVETFIQSAEDPEASLNETSAGGGKTLIDIYDVANMLFKGKVKRPLVIAPGGLVRNWVNEILKFSNGKINVFALTIQSLRRLQYTYTKNPDPVAKVDFKVIRQLIESMPPNTIFVAPYKFLINGADEIVYGNKVINRLYIAEFLRDVRFDFVGVDESHYAKNLSSLTTLATSVVVSAAKYKRLLSGTPVTDTLTDLVGQAGVMLPQALGSTGQFLKNYGAIEDEDGQTEGEWNPDAAALITNDLKPYIQRIVNKRQKWAAMLPDLHEEFHPVEMTEKQNSWYILSLRKKLDELRQKDPKLYAKLIDGNEKDVKAIESGLNTHFQSIEQFLYAPDSDEGFVKLPGLSPEDLVSPKVAEVVKILDKHFNGYTDVNNKSYAPDTNKVIVFSHRTKTSLHVMKNLPDRYKKMAVHYEAGNFKALQSFLNDPNIKVLVADEISINTGQNFQIASRMIRLETLWSPGGQEQATARIWRPAFSIGSGRVQVFLDWIFTDHSLEVAKIGRLISKIITKTRYDQQDNPSFTREVFNLEAIDKDFQNTFKDPQRGTPLIPAASAKLPINDMLGELKLIKMNSETLLKTNSVDQLYKYFAYYALIGRWDTAEFNKLKKQKRYMSMVNVPDTAYKVIPNSKTVIYTPRVPGVDPAPFDPQNKMEFKPISIIEGELDNAAGDDEDDEKNLVEINPVQIDQLVNTEFGYGTVTKLLKTDIWVDIKGIGEVKVPKATAWVIGNKAAEAELIKRLNRLGEAGDPKLPALIMNLIKQNPVKPPVIGRPAKEVDFTDYEEEQENEIEYTTRPAAKELVQKFDQYDEDEDEETENLPVLAEIVDTQITLVTDSDSQSEFLLESRGWKRIAPYQAVLIPNIGAFEKVLEGLQSSFKINAKYIENLEYYKTMLRNKSLDYAKSNALNQTIRFFAVDEHSPVKQGFLRPFPLIWGQHFYLAFDLTRDASVIAATKKIKSMSITGVKVIQQKALNVKFFANKEAAVQELSYLNKKIPNSEYSQTLKFLQNIKVKADIGQAEKIKDIAQQQAKPKSFAVKTTPVSQAPKSTPVAKSPNVQTATPKAPTKPKFTLNLRGVGKIK